MPGLESQPLDANASGVQKEKTIEDYFQGRWLASFDIQGKRFTPVVEVKDGGKWYEDGVFHFNVVGFSDKEIYEGYTMLNFKKIKAGQNYVIVSRLKVDSDGMRISGVEQNSRYGQTGVVFTKF